MVCTAKDVHSIPSWVTTLNISTPCAVCPPCKTYVLLNAKWLQQQQKHYTANLNSKITDKLRDLSVISKQRQLFLNISESCCNHRQMSVKTKIKSHIQQKN